MATDFSLILRRLEIERKQLSKELERLRTSVISSQERREEDAIEGYELEKQLILREQIEDSLAEIEHALRKFELGTYGLCENCGRRIEPARLEAIPQASLCLSCKATQTKNRRIGSPLDSRRVSYRGYNAYTELTELEGYQDE